MLSFNCEKLNGGKFIDFFKSILWLRLNEYSLCIIQKTTLTRTIQNLQF